MGEEIKASTQYGDLNGTIALDGWDSLSLLSLGIGCRKGYWPVGVEICAEQTSKGDDLDPSIYVLAIDESILEGKCGPDAVRDYARRNGRLPVFRFESRQTWAGLLARLVEIKRFDVVLQGKNTDGARLELVGSDEIFGHEAAEADDA